VRLGVIYGLSVEVWGEFIGCFIAQATVGSFPIIKKPIVFDDHAGFGDGKEDFLVETLFSKAAMKTFDKAILRLCCMNRSLAVSC
jgi:hypothetical protein